MRVERSFGQEVTVTVGFYWVAVNSSWHHRIILISGYNSFFLVSFFGVVPLSPRVTQFFSEFGFRTTEDSLYDQRHKGAGGINFVFMQVGIGETANHESREREGLAELEHLARESAHWAIVGSRGAAFWNSDFFNAFIVSYRVLAHCTDLCMYGAATRAPSRLVSSLDGFVRSGRPSCTVTMTMTMTMTMTHSEKSRCAVKDSVQCIRDTVVESVTSLILGSCKHANQVQATNLKLYNFTRHSQQCRLHRPK